MNDPTFFFFQKVGLNHFRKMVKLKKKHPPKKYIKELKSIFAKYLPFFRCSVAMVMDFAKKK